MRQFILAVLGALTLAVAPALADPALPRAIFADPPADTAHPPRSEVLHIPSGGVAINGLAYLAAGAGPHPTLVLLHGLPGNEKNLDLAQAVRRAGWNVVTFNYRGSWGSPGTYSFAGNLDDAAAVLAYLRDPANAARLQVRTDRMVLSGHSMGGWVTALAAARDPKLAGAILISAADMGLAGLRPRADAVAGMAGNMEALAGVTAQSMADEVARNAQAFSLLAAAPGLAGKPLLILTSDDGLAPHAEALARALRAQPPPARLTTVHVAADHGWSGARIRLASEVIGWLEALP